ncbi:MAG: flavodoxin family protein [Clostridia bacterium]|nr:flavodoxin family protein [Clostridia bacterium]MBO5298941.1 flavodoxin family protein [Clostridia bacterium]
MKVLMLNGSPHTRGTTAMALKEMQAVFEEQGIEVETVDVGAENVRGCVACYSCFKTGKCAIDDIVNEIAVKFEQADGLVLGSPVYYASANATLIAVLDRLFYSTKFRKTMKVGAAVCCARRGGITATHDELNKYFTISGMPIASGQYWTGVHGGFGEHERDDKEGLQQTRTLARNMAFLMKSIELGKEKYGLPERELPEFTNFIR